MAKVQHQVFGLLGNGDEANYYAFDTCQHIVIPNNIDYKTASIQSRVHSDISQAELDMYAYHTDLVTTCNEERVAFMKEFLIDKKITSIDGANTDFTLGVEYEIYNKDGILIKSGQSSALAKFCNALITEDVKSDNTLEYRKGLVLDARVELDIPPISRYGIKCAYAQNPYTIKLTKMIAKTTTGDSNYIKESNVQVNTKSHISGNYGQYYWHKGEAPCDPLCHNNFSSSFMTNAHIGTTIIDQLVVPAVLEAPVDNVEVTMASINLSGSQYTVKITENVSSIVVNFELLLDNFNVVYDINDISEILRLNATPEDTSDDENTEEHIGDNTGDNTDTPGDGNTDLDGDGSVDDEL